MPFAPVTTLDDLDSLDHADVLEGYKSAERGDPEPGENRGRAFWHGWRCRMFDFGELKAPREHLELTKAYVDRIRRQRTADTSHKGG